MPGHGPQALARRALRSAALARRAVLAAAALFCWGNLGMMLYLSRGVEAKDLGRGAALLPWFRPAYPPATALVVLCLAALVLRRSYAAAGLAALGLWAMDFVVRPVGGEHSHLLTLSVLFVYAGVGLLRGRGDAAEKTAWEACCAVAGCAYLLAGIAKIEGGLDWINRDYLRLLATSGASQARGWLHALRLALGESEAFALAGGAYTVAVELAGPAMLSPRWRPWYTPALLILHIGFAAGIGVFWPHQMLLVGALGLPLEAAFLRWSRRSGD